MSPGAEWDPHVGAFVDAMAAVQAALKSATAAGKREWIDVYVKGLASDLTREAAPPQQHDQPVKPDVATTLEDRYWGRTDGTPILVTIARTLLARLGKDADDPTYAQRLHFSTDLDLGDDGLAHLTWAPRLDQLLAFQYTLDSFPGGFTEFAELNPMLANVMMVEMGLFITWDVTTKKRKGR